MWAALRLHDCLHARSERITASVLRSHHPITRLHGMAKMSTVRRLRMRPGASVRSCRVNSKLGHLAGARPGDVHPYLMRGRSIVVAHCEKSAAVASLEAQTNGLSDHLESVASKMKKSPGQFSATESQDLQDIEEIYQENYYQKIEEADAPVVLVDFYTQWCGPCKLMYPQLVAMKGELEGEVTFYKFNCNKANKELGTKLEIKVAPTFILYKAGEEVKRLTGAKIDPLRAAVADLSE